MAVAFIGAGISFAIGLSYGLFAGFSRPRIDNFMMRVVDIIYAYPTLILIILLQVFLTSLAQQPPEALGPLQALMVTLDIRSGGLFFVFVARPEQAEARTPAGKLPGTRPLSPRPRALRQPQPARRHKQLGNDA